MNIKTRPLLIAVAAASILLIIVNVISNAVSLLLTPDIGTIDPNDPFAGIPTLALAVSCVGLICAVLAYVGAGFLYTNQAGKAAPMEMQDGVIGGAVAGLLAGIIVAIIGGIINLGITALIGPDIASQLGDLPPEAAGIIGISTVFGGAIGLVVGTCCQSLIGAVLGAVGGAIGAAVGGN